MGKVHNYRRPDTAKLFHHVEGMLLSGADTLLTISSATAVGDWAALTVSYTDANDNSTVVVTSGVPRKIGGVVGILLRDTKTTTTGTYAISGKWRAPLKTAEVTVAGTLLYWDSVVEKFTATTAGPTDPVVGIAIAVQEVLGTGNAYDLPNGTYVQMFLFPNQTRL